MNLQNINYKSELVKIMNQLILKEMNQERVIYLYKPEGNGEEGGVVYNLLRNEATVLK